MRFAKAQEKKMGKPESNVPVVKKQGPQKSPISKPWIKKTGYGVGERASTDFGMSMRRESDREGDIGTYICGNKRDVTWIQEEGEEEEANWHILSYNYLG
ncbi:hypothetical protein BM1_03616 [Bipolaris maydis]|nr:hypothetical protein BM1_03616 [Bipolaris maydis]